MADYGFRNDRPNNGNPNNFSSFTEVDDMEFLNHPKHGTSGYMLGNEPSYYGQSADTRRMQLEQEIQMIGERTLGSTERSLGLIHESERMGIATAEELLHQREQLQNAERKVDDINSMLKSTQKHINSIKSVFGGIKNYFSKTPEQRIRKSVVEEPIEAPSSSLEGVVQQVKQETPAFTSIHPGLRIRGLNDDSSIHFNDDGDNEEYWQHSAHAPQRPQPQVKQKYKEIEARMDANLDEMSSGLSRLKGLASSLGNEIDEQNQMIGKIMEKTERGEGGIATQNHQLRRILGR